MAEPRWLTKARTYVGLREQAGRKHNPQILAWWTAIRAPFTDDETPWCAGFVGGILEACNIKSTRSAAARSYRNYGKPLEKPIVGCIVVFERGPANGHVGFYVGQDRRGNPMILGGNQGDAVNIKPFDLRRVLAYRWPPGEPIPAAKKVLLDDDQELSSYEGILSQMPDDPGVDEPERKSFLDRAQGWFAGLGGTGIIGSLFDWKVALVLVVAGFLVFLILLYTRRI